MSLLKWALIMLVVSLVAALFGFTGLSAASADVARVRGQLGLEIREDTINRDLGGLIRTEHGARLKRNRQHDENEDEPAEHLESHTGLER